MILSNLRPIPLGVRSLALLALAPLGDPAVEGLPFHRRCLGVLMKRHANAAWVETHASRASA